MGMEILYRKYGAATYLQPIKNKTKTEAIFFSFSAVISGSESVVLQTTKTSPTGSIILLFLCLLLLLLFCLLPNLPIVTI